METFVIRVWEGEGEAAAGAPSMRLVQGIVEHVRSGRSAPFRRLEELGALILASLEQLDGPTAQPGGSAGRHRASWGER